VTRLPVALLALLPAALVGQPPDLPPFVKQYSRAATFYYLKPDPSLGPKMLAELLKKENLEHPLFARNAQLHLLIGAQLGDIATGHPEVVRQYEKALADAPPKGRQVIIRALTNAGDKETAKAVGEWVKDARYADQKAELEALKAHLEDPKRAHARDVPARAPKDLDYLWANFMVTGEYAPVSRILDVFDLPDDKENEKLKKAARWSFGSNVQQHPKLVELVLQHKKDRPAGSQKVIDETIIVPKK
jgi:hypothetical protein